jgi:homoserine kinase
VANVAVGFDVLGFAVDAAGDRVTATAAPASTEVYVTDVTGIVTALPRDPARNTASVAVAALLRDHPVGHGLELHLDKGIPLGSGMGGSAASAVAAVVAANAFLEAPLSPDQLLPYAMEGEAVASGSAHADNVAPSLLGGMTAVVGMDPVEVVGLPVPTGLLCVLVHPRFEVETRSARTALGSELPLTRHVRQSMYLTGFLAACYRNDLGLLERSMVDLVAEPARAALIPGLAEARAGAMEAGALGFAISGAGPSVFAFVGSEDVGREVQSAIVAAFTGRGHETEAWLGPIRTDGATIVASEAVSCGT